jgi:hypothetical protein
VIIDLISATTTKTGLKVYPRLDESSYPAKIDVSDAELAQIQLQRHSRVLLERDPAARLWVTFVPGLDSLEQTREAILGYLEAAEREDLAIPEAQIEAEVVELEVATP